MKVSTWFRTVWLGTVAVMAIVGVSGTFTLERLSSAHKEVKSTRDVIDRLEYLLYRVSDAGASERAFIITGDDNFLEAFRESSDECEDTYRDLKDMLAGNNKQMERLEGLHGLIKQRLSMFESTIEVFKARGAEAAFDKVRHSQGAEMRRKVHAAMSEIKKGQEAELQDLYSEVDIYTNNAAMTLFCGTFLAIAFVTFTHLLFGTKILRCLEKLLRSGQNIEKGRYDTVVALSTNDELQELGESMTVLAQKLAHTTDELARSTQEAQKYKNLFQSAEGELSKLVLQIDLDCAGLLERAGDSTQTWLTRNRQALDSVHSSGSELLNRLAAVKNKFDFASSSTDALCASVEEMHELMAALDSLSNELDVVAVASGMELAKHADQNPAVKALVEKLKSLSEHARHDKIKVQILLAKLQSLSGKASLSSQDATASAQTTQLSADNLMETLRAYPVLEHDSRTLIADLLASVKSHTILLIEGRDRLRGILKDLYHAQDTETLAPLATPSPDQTTGQMDRSRIPTREQSKPEISKENREAASGTKS